MTQTSQQDARIPSSDSMNGEECQTRRLPDPSSFVRLQAPKIDPVTRFVTDALLVGRHVLLTMMLPMLERRPEKAMDADNLKMPLEDWETEFLHKRLLALGTYQGDEDMVEVPRVRKGDITPAEVQELIQHTPLVFEGLAKDSDALKKWSLEYLKHKYGSAGIWITKTDLTEYEGTVGELLDDMLAGKKTEKYVRSAADVFLDQPDLERALPFDKMKYYLGDLASHFGTELFMGGPDTGTPFHCAPFYNFFTLVHGVKDWIFIHPSHTRWMYGLLHVTGFGASRVRHRDPKEVVDAKYPLYRRIPKMKTRISAGDMLINPPWWWHCVDNATPSTIGVATRWAEPALTKNNPRYELTSQLSKLARTVHREARQARRGRRLTDAIWREKFHLKPKAIGFFKGAR